MKSNSQHSPNPDRHARELREASTVALMALFSGWLVCSLVFLAVRELVRLWTR